MHASSLDLIEKSELPSGQARAILQAMDSELARRDLATKADLKAQIEASEARLLLAISEGRRETAAMGTKLVLWSAGFWIGAIGVLCAIFKGLK